MKNSRLLLVILAIALVTILSYWYFNRRPGTTENQDPSLVRHDARSSSTKPQKVSSNKFPPFERPKDLVPNFDKPYVPPKGPQIGEYFPMTNKIEIKEIDIDRNGNPLNQGGADVVFYKYGETGAGPGGTPDVSGASNRNVVMLSYNWAAELSLDSGETYTVLNPTTIFPSGPVNDAAGNNISNGFCCDQVIQYVPSIDRFIWFMQFCGNGAGCLQGSNIIRIASASTNDVINSGGTAWTYWDISSTQVGSTAGALDYPDMSVGTNSLYISMDAVGMGLVVMRLPLAEIQNGSGFTFWYTQAGDGQNAYGGHISQNTGDEVYWAGHVNTSKLRIFSWKEGQNTYAWRDRDINSYNSGMSSTTPSGVDWLQGSNGFPGNAVLGITRRNNEVWFAWNSNAIGGYQNAYIPIVKVRNTDYNVIEQSAIWNNDYAFAYPCLSTNADGEVGISLGWGGRTTEAHHAAGFMGDFVVYYPRLSAGSLSRYGDYVSIRRFNQNGSLFSAFGYTTQANPPPAGGLFNDVHYILFGRPDKKRG